MKPRRLISAAQGRSDGQSFLETALFLPLLLLFIAGPIEVGVYGLSYLTLLDATREAARFGANLDPELTSKHPLNMHGDPFPDVRSMSYGDLVALCGTGESTNFYYEVACLALQNIPSGTLNIANGDDIVISVVGVLRGQIAYRWPLTPTHAHPNDQPYHFRGATDGPLNPSCTITNTSNCRSWSLYGNRSSALDNATILRSLNENAPNTGFVIVEVFHAHPHFLGLFSIGDFIPDPINTWTYSIFPVPAAEPRE